MEKKKFDLYVKGNLLYHDYCACKGAGDGAKLETHVPPEEVDLMHGIVIEGDMIVDSIYVVNKKVGASGTISKTHNINIIENDNRRI